MIARTQSPTRGGAAGSASEGAPGGRSGATAAGPPAGAGRRLHAALLLAVALLSFAAFAPALRAGFVSWDDGLTVTGNHRFRGLSASHGRWMATTSHAGHYQPLTWASLALDHARLGLTPPDHPEASGFHATNLVLHALGAVVLYLLAIRLLDLGFGAAAPRRRSLLLAAAFAALFHAVHPLRCESVCWVTERRDVLSAPLFLLAVLAYLRAAPAGGPPRVAPRWLVAASAATAAAALAAAASVSLEDPEALQTTALAPLGLPLAALGLAAGGACAARGVDPGATPRRALWLSLSLLALAFSLLAKAWGIVMPALLLVLDVWPLRRLAAATSGRAAAALVLEKLPMIALAAGFAILARWAQVAQQGTLDAWQIHTVGERVVQALYGLAFYPAKTLVPLGLYPLYPVPDTVRLGEPRFALAALATLGITAGLLAVARRAPALLAAWAAYAVMVSPVLGLQQSGPQLVADRYAHLAGIPFALLAGAGLGWALERGGRIRRLGLVLAPAIVALLMVGSWRQSHVWRSSESLWTHALAGAPESAMVRLNLGLVRLDQALASADPARRHALLERALAQVRAARARRPDDPLYAMNEAIVRAERARTDGPDAAAELAAAIDLGFEAIRRAAAAGERDGAWHLQQGRMLMRAGRLEEAVRELERAVALRPAWPAPRRELARALLADPAVADDPGAGLAAAARALEALAPLSGEADTGDVRVLRALALDLRAGLRARVGPAADAEAARAAARDAWRRVPADHPAHADALRRIRALSGRRD